MILTDRHVIDQFAASGIWGDATLLDLFDRTVLRTPDKLALVDPPNRATVSGGLPRRLTYGQLSSTVDNLVRAFRSLQLQPDDVVAFQLPNIIEQVVVLLAAQKCRLIASPVPLLWREHELKSALPLIGPKVLLTSRVITGRNHEALMCSVAADLMSVRAVMSFGDGVMDGVVALDGIFAEEDDPALPVMADHITVGGANEVATVCWAGGDTPTPCPTPRSHNQWIAAGMMALLEAEIDESSVILCPYPLNSLLSIGAFMVPWLMSGATLALHHPFDVNAFVEQLRTESVSVAGLPPAVIDLLKSEDAFGSEGKARTLKTLACVWPGPLLPKDAEERAADLIASVIDIRAFGEMVYVAKRRVAGERPAELEHGDFRYPTKRAGGVVLLQTRVKGGISSNTQTSSLLTGDLMIKSPMMFDAYYPAAIEGIDEPVITKDPQGYVNTGLRCVLTGTAAAKVEIVRRNSNVIFYGGLSVSAHELDQLYAEFHGISDAAAFAFDDPVMGERILAAVVPQPGMTIAFEEFVDYLNERRVAPYKVPDRLVTVKCIPRDDDGAILRDKVLDQI